MFSRIVVSFLAAVIVVVFPFSSQAQDDQHAGHDMLADHVHNAGNRAPIGVMGDHMHDAGTWMMSYRYMRMDMDGSRIGTDRVDPVSIATTVPNRFFGVAGQPSTVRVVPTSMTMDMHMFGTMYAFSDWFTGMAMVNYLEKEMDHITFAGGAGTTERGNFTTKSEGLGDVKLSGLIRVYQDDVHHVHLNAGLSVPTGSIKEEGSVLAPNGDTLNLRLPYAMQLGTGTYDALPGVTYTGVNERWNWGAQYSAEIRMENKNDEGYAWGDKHMASVWAGYGWADWVTTSLRLSGSSQSKIDGIDAAILAPVQTADPDNFGGRVIELGAGVNLLGMSGVLKDHGLALEASVPLYRNLNGPQLETDYSFTLGWNMVF